MTGHTCPRCGEKLSENVLECPNCGLHQTRKSSDAPANLIVLYFRSVWEILTRPAQFFARMPMSGGLGRPLAFALITHWIGASVSYLWRGLVGAGLRDYMETLSRLFGGVTEIDSPARHEQYMQIMEARDRLLHWFWGTGSVIADPFLTLGAILFTSFFVFIGARILVTSRNGAISFESAVRIVCYGLTPAILAGLPLFGPLIAPIYVAIVTIIGAKQVYRIGTGRAIAVALFPKLLFLGIIILGAFFFAIAFIKLLVSAI